MEKTGLLQARLDQSLRHKRLTGLDYSDYTRLTRIDQLGPDQTKFV